MAVYYVKVAGGTGSGQDDANAWSYSKLNSTNLAPGDTIYFKKGETFNGPLTVRTGSVGNPITYSSYGMGANPIISGFSTLTGWIQSTGNIWYTTLDVPQLHGVTVDGVVKAMGRYPNTGHLIYTGTNGTVSPFSAATNISGTSVGTIPFDPTGGEVVIRKYRWVLDRNQITSRSGNTLNFSNNGFYGSNSAYPTVIGNGYFIQNHIGCLDQDGDWMYDNPNNRVYMYFSGNPNTRVVRASTVDIVVLCNARNYVNFNGIDFEGGNYAVYTLNGTSNMTFTNCNFRKQGGNAGVITGSDNITFTGGSASDSLNTCMLFENCNGTIVDGMTITNAGIIPGAGQSSDGGYQGIRATGGSATIVNNRITNVGYCPIYHIGSNFLCEFNFIDNHGLVKDDSGGIYTVNSSDVETTNIVIRNNIVLNGVGAVDGTAGDPNQEFYGKASGIYLDDNTNHATVSNNFIANMAWSGIVVHRGFNNMITNNIVYNTLSSFNIIDEVAATRNTIVTGNKFIARTASQRTMFIEIFTNDNPSLYGTFNNNYYARPISEGATITVKAPNGQLTNYTLSGWNSAYGLDTTSSVSKVTTNNLNDFRIEYNDSPSAATKPLTAIYKDVENISYDGSVALDPFEGVVLLYSSNIVPTTGKIFRSPTGKILIFNGKVLLSA